MSGCVDCGAPTGRRRCRDCDLADRRDQAVNVTAPEWCDQTGLGDRDPAGQTTLDGGLVREVADGDE
jgi:hypothetical protein